MDLDQLDIIMFDEDEELVEYINHINRPRPPRYLGERNDLFNTLPDDKFVRRFRLTKPTVLLLLQEIHDDITSKTTKNNAVSPLNQLLCTLRFYATGSQLITCGDVIGVQESTACQIIHRVTHAIASLYKKYIKLPETEAEQRQAAKEFYNICKFPRVIGAIDCTHIRIISPGGDNAEIFRNRKGYFSINTQCVAAANLQFIDVVARWHGSAHDSNMWDNCALKSKFLRGKFNNKLLLGDSGYAQTSFMMTPLPEGRRSRAESLYQESQIKTRNVVERAFGVWKRRFPIMSRGINLNLCRVPGTIIATAILHNIAIGQKESVPPEDPDYPVLEEMIENLRDPTASQNRGAARNIDRTCLIEEYFESL